MDASTVIMVAVFAANLLPLLLVPIAFILVRRALRRHGTAGTMTRLVPRPRTWLRYGWLLAIPVCAFAGLMVATIGGALHPSLLMKAAPYVCDGKVEIESRKYSYKPGQQGVARQMFCIEADGSPRDITLPAIGATSLYYALIFLAAVLTLGVGLFLFRPRRSSEAAAQITSQSHEDLKNFLADRLRVSANVVRHPTVGPGADSGNAEQRLRHLQSLRDANLISAEEYQAKRAEILSSL
jgi:hypothetical protein